MNKNPKIWLQEISNEIQKNQNAKLITLEINSNEQKTLHHQINSLSNKLKKQNELQELDQNKTDILIGTLAIRRFLERWRKKHKKSIKHWLTIQPTTKESQIITIHGILYTNKTNDIYEKWNYGKVTISEKINETIITNMITNKYSNKLALLTSYNHKK